MHEFEVNGHRYVSTPMNARDQYRVAKRLGVAAGLLQDVNWDKGSKAFVIPFILASSRMPDEQSDYIIDTCLNTVRLMTDNNTPAPLMAKGQMMRQDMSMNEMLEIVGRVLRANLADFFPELQSALMEVVSRPLNS